MKCIDWSMHYLTDCMISTAWREEHSKTNKKRTGRLQKEFAVTTLEATPMPVPLRYPVAQRPVQPRRVAVLRLQDRVAQAQAHGAAHVRLAALWHEDDCRVRARFIELGAVRFCPAEHVAGVVDNCHLRTCARCIVDAPAQTCMQKNGA